MAIYKIFPNKDTTLYSFYPNMNAGRDEILELTTFRNPIISTEQPETSRILIKFDTNEINDVFTKYISSSTWSASLDLYLANASNIPLDYSLVCFPISQSWNMGTGKYLDSPQITDGTSWVYSNFSGSNKWATSSYAAGVTGSYGVTSGGATWYTSSTFSTTQSFSYVDNKDISFNVTNTVSSWISNSISNDGFIVKYLNEFVTSSYSSLKYFSMDTSTIYPPSLTMKWNDFTHVTGSYSTVTSNNINISFSNNKNEFEQDSIQKFYLGVRPRFPQRQFLTSSVYLKNYYLPTSSYYSIKDLDTNEVVIDFDEIYTKISADADGNYFKIYCSGLEPLRYYKILIKTKTFGEEVIFDNDYYFKVVL